MKITIVVENYTNRADLIPEYGLSVHIADGDASLLMDTGQRDALFTNAPLLGIDLSALEHIILSHGHFDHAGALARLLMQTKDPLLWAHPAVLDMHSRFRRGRMTFIGCHLNREAVRFREITGLTRITDNVFAMEIPAEQMVKLFEQHGQEIFKRRLSLWGIVRAPYSPEPLKRLLSAPGLFG